MVDFYLDHNMERRIAAGLRTAGYSVVTAHEWGYEELLDDRHLWVAARARRILLTHDNDMREIHRNWAQRTGLLRELPLHHGIIVVPAHPVWSIEQTVRELVALVGRRASLIGEGYEWVDGAWAALPVAPATLDSHG